MSTGITAHGGTERLDRMRKLYHSWGLGGPFTSAPLPERTSGLATPIGMQGWVIETFPLKPKPGLNGRLGLCIYPAK
jgi:hypothetical protein